MDEYITFKREKKIELRLTKTQFKKLKKTAKLCDMSVSSYVLARGYGYFPKAILTKKETKLLEILSRPKTHFDHLNNAFMLFSQDDLQNWYKNYGATMNKIYAISHTLTLIKNFIRRVCAPNRIPRNYRTPMYIEIWIKKHLKTLDGFEANDNYLFQLHYQTKIRNNSVNPNAYTKKTEEQLQALWDSVRNNAATVSDNANAFYAALRSHYEPYRLSPTFMSNLKIYSNNKQRIKPGRLARASICVNSIHIENIRYTAAQNKTNISNLLISRALNYVPRCKINEAEAKVLKDLRYPIQIENEIDVYTSRLIQKKDEERIAILKNEKKYFVGMVGALYNMVWWLKPFILTQITEDNPIYKKIFFTF